ncbi:MAG: hypothetical protein MSA68_06420, partial [Helicobacter sp.]|nr:hypothetical protein [Helicobacter sp.]
QSHSKTESGGVALVSVASLCPISEYDYKRWGDYWRFTDMGIKRDFEEVFGVGNVEVVSYGNVLSATAEIQGISAQELTTQELFYHDKNYPVIIGIKAYKRI